MADDYSDVYCIVSRLSMVGFVEILLYLVHLGTFDSKRRRMSTVLNL
jgi:hypothetical protein